MNSPEECPAPPAALRLSPAGRLRRAAIRAAVVRAAERRGRMRRAGRAAVATAAVTLLLLTAGPAERGDPVAPAAPASAVVAVTDGSPAVAGGEVGLAPLPAPPPLATPDLDGPPSRVEILTDAEFLALFDDPETWDALERAGFEPIVIESTGGIGLVVASASSRSSRIGP